MNKKLVDILVSIGVLVIALGFVLWFFLAGGTDGSGGVFDNNQIATEEKEKSKEEITIQDFKSSLESVNNFQFTVEITEGEALDFAYEGLVSLAIVKYNSTVVASLDVYDSEENAQKVIDDIKASNTAGFQEETGKKFESLSTDTAFVERVGKTFLTINADDSKVIDEIRKATKY